MMRCIFRKSGRSFIRENPVKLGGVLMELTHVSFFIGG